MNFYLTFRACNKVKILTSPYISFVIQRLKMAFFAKAQSKAHLDQGHLDQGNYSVNGVGLQKCITNTRLSKMSVYTDITAKTVLFNTALVGDNKILTVTCKANLPNLNLFFFKKKKLNKSWIY